MKKYILLINVLLCTLNLAAQLNTGTPPAVEWSKTDIWPNTPFKYTLPKPNITADLSGEDWFYTVKVVHDSSNHPTGYVCGGYVTIPDLNGFDTTDASIYNSLGGWYTAFVSNNDCSDLRLNQNISGYKRLVSGPFMPAITKLGLDGSYSFSEYVPFETHGEFKGAIPTKDGGFIGYGYTFFSSRLGYENGQLSEIYPIYYNPIIGQPNVSFEVNSNGVRIPPLGYVEKSLVVKYDANLNVKWYYSYGSVPYAAGASNPAYWEGSEATAMVECDGGYLIAGGSASVGAWLQKIDYNGSVIWTGAQLGKKVFASNMNSNIKSVCRIIENGSEYFYVAGRYDAESIYVAKLDANGNVLWTTVENPSPTSGQVDDVNSIDIASDGNVYVSGVSNVHDIAPAKTGGTGFIYKISYTNGTNLYAFTEPFECAAQDIRYSLTSTSDGGCAVVSTVFQSSVGCNFQIPQNYSGYSGTYYTPYFAAWNSDAYVAKFSPTLVKIWSTAFDAATNTPGGNALDILNTCSACGSGCPITSWEIPNQSGYDVSRRECMFGITEAPDRSIVIAGKNSRNLDDCYLVKMSCESQSSAMVLTNQTIANTEFFKAGAITTNNQWITASTARVNMDACHYILFDKVTSLNSGSVITTSLDPLFCCNSVAGGMRSASINAVSSGLSSSGNADILNNIRINIFPNPSGGIFSVRLESAQSETIYMEIIDIQGKLIGGKKVMEVINLFNTEVNISSMPKGIYLLKFYSGKNILTKKVVVE